MFRRYLLKKKFWQSKTSNGGVMFVKHDSHAGGVYAQVLRNPEGHQCVEVQVNGEKKYFENFNDLDAFLDNLRRPSQDPIFSVLGRRNNETFFRKLEI